MTCRPRPFPVEAPSVTPWTPGLLGFDHVEATATGGTGQPNNKPQPILPPSQLVGLKKVGVIPMAFF